MADSLREAAEAARDELQRLWNLLCDEDADSVESVVLRLSDSLSAPDPVAEAREIIEGLMNCYDGEKQMREWYPWAGKARDWLARNGGTSD